MVRWENARVRNLVVLSALATWLMGCAAAAPQPAMQSSPHEAAIEAARADASKRSGLPAREMKVVALESVTWRDGSLGCPRDDQDLQYTQALVPGYRIRLQVGSETWDYHASERGRAVLCPPGRSQEPAPGSGRS